MATKMKKEKDTTTNSTVHDRASRTDLLCSLCRPNRGENIKNYKKHGRTKPKRKNKRD